MSQTESTENESFPELEELKNDRNIAYGKAILVLAMLGGFILSLLTVPSWAKAELASVRLLQGQSANEAAAAFGGYLLALLGAIVLAVLMTGLLGLLARRQTERRMQAIMDEPAEGTKRGLELPPPPPGPMPE